MISIYDNNLNLIVDKNQALQSKDLIWINVYDPTSNEINDLLNDFNIDVEFIEASLDSEERSRIDEIDDQSLIIVNASIKKNSKYDKSIYETIPVGIIIKDNFIFSICRNKLDVFDLLTTQKKGSVTIKRIPQFITKIIYLISSSYLKALRMVDSRTEQIENMLYKESRKEYLLELLNMEKTLVYFNTALNGNEIVVKRILRTNLLNHSEKDQEMLEDTIIEIQQASEMAMVNSRIINSIRSAFESINNNSLNIIMKSLASITIILNVPMLITSFFGMNVKFPNFVSASIFFLILLTVVMSLVTFIIYKIMKKKDML